MLEQRDQGAVIAIYVLNYSVFFIMHDDFSLCCGFVNFKCEMFISVFRALYCEYVSLLHESKS